MNSKEVDSKLFEQNSGQSWTVEYSREYNRESIKQWLIDNIPRAVKVGRWTGYDATDKIVWGFYFNYLDRKIIFDQQSDAVQFQLTWG